MKIRLPGLLAAAVLVVVSLAEGAAQNVPPTPPPPIPGAPTTTPGVQIPIPAPPTAAPATPTPTPTPRGRRATPTPKPSGSPSETPAPPQFSTLDGIWEVELQTHAKTTYSHFSLKQSGQAGSEVAGFWLRDNRRLPLTGTFDGRLFKFTVADGTAQFTFSGYVENYSDIVGLLNDGKSNVAFTAQHRKREKAL